MRSGRNNCEKWIINMKRQEWMRSLCKNCKWIKIEKWDNLRNEWSLNKNFCLILNQIIKYNLETTSV